MDYVALSYVWGQTEGLRTEKTLLPQLQEPGALLRLGPSLPETIRDAMGLVELLGERYLWVDSLCIPQDDEENKLRDINRMAEIYSNSLVTIIAADGHDSGYGLPGIQGLSRARELHQEVFRLEGNEMVVQQQLPKSELEWMARSQVPYFQRGWTFQEYLFSKRRLMFESQIVRWECASCTWNEDIVHAEGPEANPILVGWMR
jgi:hypothetical protein